MHTSTVYVLKLTYLLQCTHVITIKEKALTEHNYVMWQCLIALQHIRMVLRKVTYGFVIQQYKFSSALRDSMNELKM